MDSYSLYDRLEKGLVPGVVRPFSQHIKGWLLSEKMMEGLPPRATDALNHIAKCVRARIKDLELLGANDISIRAEENLHLAIIVLRDTIEAFKPEKKMKM